MWCRRIWHAWVNGAGATSCATSVERTWCAITRHHPQPYALAIVTRDMQPRDDFPRSLIDVANGVDAAKLSRHLPILRRCVPADDRPLLLARAHRPGDRAAHLLLLTRRRLVVTAESRVLRRRRLHLNTNPLHLMDVLWTSEPSLGGLAFSATAVDGVREHFWVRTTDPDAAADALASVFRRVPIPV